MSEDRNPPAPASPPAAPTEEDSPAAPTDAPDEPAEPASYKVGYGRPPPEHRIKPGERRNPKGRPKGSRNVKTLIRAEHNRRIRVNENGVVRSKPAIEVLLRRDMTDALKGDERAKARQLALAQHMAAEDEAKERGKSRRELTAEDEAILARHLPQPPQPATDPASEAEQAEPQALTNKEKPS